MNFFLDNSISILGVKINALNLEQALEKVKIFINSNRTNLVVTPNPEFLLCARKNEPFKRILNAADLSLPDGAGLVWAARYLGLPRVTRLTGTDFVWQLTRYASENNLSIYLLGGERGVAKKAAQSLMTQFPRLKIVGATSGYDQQSRMRDDAKLVSLINRARPDILLVALGAPNQELWISRNKDKFNSVRVAMGVGGAFDYLAKVVPRAPQFMRSAGLEWLFRLIIQPSRIKRIYNAVIKFPIIIIFKSFSKTN